MIISAEYENGAIKLWPAPSDREGKELAEGILQNGPASDQIQELESQVDHLDRRVGDLQDELSELRCDFRTLESELESLNELEPTDIKEALEKILRRFF